MLNIHFTDDAWADYQHWKKTNKQKLARINKLIENAQRNPFEGLGKPEPLKFALAGCWSRRIDHEHRLVYTVQDGKLIIMQCRYHY